MMMTNNQKTTSINSLSIQVRLDGLSFFIQNTLSRKCESYKHIPFQKTVHVQNLVEALEGCYDTYPELSDTYNKVNVVYDNDLFTVVPTPLFAEEKASQYLQFNTKILVTDFIAHDTLERYDLTTIYIPYTNTNNFFFDTYGAFDYFHSSTLLIEYLLPLGSDIAETKVVAIVSKNHFDIVIHKKQELLLANRFEIKTKEDFIYYILFTYEQLGLDPDKVALYLSGKVERDDENYSIAYNYIRDIHMLESPSTSIPKNDFILATLI